MNKRIFLSSPTMYGDEQKYIKEAFDTNWVAPLGANVNGLEKSMSDYLGIRGAVALSAGTAALHLAVKAAGVKQDDIVFCSDMTFSATVNPVSYEGGKQVFIDCEKESWNMDPAALRRAAEKYPAALWCDYHSTGDSAASRITPRPWATAIPVVIFLVKNSSSTAISSG